MCSQLVTIQCAGWDRAFSGNLEEIDESTALVLADHPVGAGTQIRIQCGMNQLRGAVTNCLQDALGCFIEVDLDSHTHWSKDWFVPEHFFGITGQASSKVLHRKMASGV